MKEVNTDVRDTKEVLEGVLEQTEELNKALYSLKKKHQRHLCRYCSADISIKEIPERGKISKIPHDLDGTPHWKTCLAGKYVHRRMAVKMVQKFGIYFLLKHGIDLEQEVNFTKEEATVMQYIIDRAIKDNVIQIKSDVGQVEEPSTDDTVKEGLKEIEEVAKKCKVDDLNYKGDDPIGDPDEDLTVAEEVIKEIEKIK